jgi:hypothetical protein
MSTPEAAVADTTVRIGLLMEAVESQRALVSSALEQLQQHTAGLDAIVRDEMRAVLAQELHALFEETQRTVALLHSAGRAMRLRQLTFGSAAAALAAAIPLGLSAWMLPSRTEVEGLRAARAELSADLTRLAQQGGRLQLRRCGAAARLCVRIDRAAPVYGESADYAIVKGY